MKPATKRQFLFNWIIFTLVLCSPLIVDSSILFVSDRDWNSETYIMDADGNNPRNLSKTEYRYQLSIILLQNIFNITDGQFLPIWIFSDELQRDCVTWFRYNASRLVCLRIPQPKDDWNCFVSSRDWRSSGNDRTEEIGTSRFAVNQI